MSKLSRGLALLCLVTIGAVCAAAQVFAETRVALVIGNSAYVHVPHLPNPANDAALVGASLRKSGFQVEVDYNLNGVGLRSAVQSFASRARNADVALIYYAGHGMEMNGINYLIPVDATLATDTDVSFEAVALDQVLSVVRAKRLGLIILDACRNNPFAGSMSISGGGHRAVSRGLARVEPVGDTLVVYAAKDGDVSEDGDGADSPFATALAKRIDEPGVEISLVFRQVRDDVLVATNNQQQPFTYGSLGGQPFYFVPPSTMSAVVSPPAPALAVQPAPIDPKAVELELWRSVESSNDANQLNAYLRRYPNGDFAGVATAKIAALARPSTPAAPDQSHFRVEAAEGGGAPLADSLQSVAQALNALMGPVTSTISGHDSSNNQSWTFTKTVAASNFRPNAASCTLSYRASILIPGAPTANTDVTIPLRQVQQVKAGTLAEAMNRNWVRTGHPTRTATISPDVYAVSVILTDGKSNDLVLTDPAKAESLAASLRQVAQVCGAGAG